ncbi:MAG: hypothetical protein EOP88_08825 [Verrucomicrobiaceae bacterium]|nr:MAG: hypothetical protein EOP88_08825 [Verrucomicrobiaceae bacterium]
MPDPIPATATPTLLYRCMTKGVKDAPESFEYGASWVTARRGMLSVHQDRLECGDWTIPYSAISQAVLFKTSQMLIPCYILKVRTATDSYQFGLSGNKFWSTDLPFPVTREKGRLRYSAFSIIARVILIAALIWYFYQAWA